MHEFARLFTLEEAMAMLPELRGRLEELRAWKAEYDTAWRELEALSPQKRSNGGAERAGRLESSIRRLANQIHGELTNLQEKGIEVKDIDTGLVDFPSKRGDRMVYLCWRLGEEAIEFWHDVDAGFAGRELL